MYPIQYWNFCQLIDVYGCNGHDFSHTNLREDSLVYSDTYPAPSVWKESLVFGPVRDIDVEQASSHDEYPNAKINGIK